MASHESNQHLVALGWPWINTTDPSSVSIAEYRQWYSHHGSTMGPNITDCSLEDEMKKVFLKYNFNFLCMQVIKTKVITCFRQR